MNDTGKQDKGTESLPGRALQWLKERWFQLRITYGSITAKELKEWGDAGARALARSVMADPSKALSNFMGTVEEFGIPPNIAMLLRATVLSASPYQDRILAVKILERDGSDANAVMNLLPILEGLRKRENNAILRAEAPDEDDLLLQERTKLALERVGDRIGFQDHMVLITCGRKEARLWALRNLSPDFSPEEVDTLRELEKLMKASKRDYREELGELRRIISNWETDCIVMGRVRAPQARKPEPPKQPEKGGKAPKKLKR